MLPILTYAGMVIAALSAIWGSVGEGKFTRTAAIAIALTLIGLFISIGASYLERQQKQSESEDALRKEIRRTREIIVASQPLTSLSFTWRIEGFDANLKAVLEEGKKLVLTEAEDSQGGSTRIPAEHIDLVHLRDPFFKALLHGIAGEVSEDDYAFDDEIPIDKESYAVLVSLDEADNAILPFGTVPEARFGAVDIAGALPPTVSSGILLCAGSYFCQSTRATGNFARLHTVDTTADPTVEIVWELDPVTLEKAIDRKTDIARPTARLPRSLKVTILFDMQKLPFPARNFARLEDEFSWERGEPIDRRGLRSTIRLVANGLDADGEALYRLDTIVSVRPIDDWGESQPVRGLLLTFVRIDGDAVPESDARSSDALAGPTGATRH